VAGASLRPMAESDLFFRIKAGDEILARHGLPGRNLFSFTYPDHPDLDASWLFEVAVAGLYRVAGFPGVVVAKTAVLLAIFAAAYALCRRRGAGAVASALALGAAALVARERFVERPHLASLAGIVGLLAAVEALAGGARRRAMITLALGVVLWANLHAGVFVAPLVLGAAALGAALERRLGRSDGQGAGAMGLAAAVSAVAMLATPLGLGLWQYLRLHLVLPALHPVDEFRAPTFTSDAPLVVYAAGAAVAIALAWWRAGARPPFRALAPIVPLALMTARAVRFAPEVALALAPLAAVALTALWARWRAPVTSPLPTVAATALLIGLAVVPRAAGRVPMGIGLDTGELPLRAIAFVDANGLRDRMYNDFEIGSYLLFDPAEGYPRHRVFVDPRLPAYPEELHRLLGRDDLTRAEWTAAMDRYGVESALLTYAGVNRRVAWWDPEVWALVFRGDDARVFVRRLPRHRALIAAHEIPATFAFSFYEGTSTVPLFVRPTLSPVPDCEWQRRLGDLIFEGAQAPAEAGTGAGGRAVTPPAEALAAYQRALDAPAGCLAAGDEGRLASWLGALALGRGDMESALALSERALARGDRELATYTNRAVALEALGRTAAAVAAWDDVIAHAGDSALGRKARARRAALHP
jgi:tetratricopeptide (TPR) repeat protein